MCWMGKIEAPPKETQTTLVKVGQPDPYEIDASIMKADAAATSRLVEIGQGGQSDETEIC